MTHNFNHTWDSSQYSKSSDLQAAVADELIKNLQIKPDENVLDIGCGIGNITLVVASIACKGRVLGIDASSSMIDQANKNLSVQGLKNISFQVMNAADFNFPGEFDVVFSNSAFHWIRDQDLLLQSICRSLKQGGRLGVQFPLLDESHPMISIMNETINNLGMTHNYISWQFPWFVPESGDTYTALLNRSGFKNITVKEAETEYRFKDTSAVVDFFKTVGSGLFIEPLSEADRILLENESRNIIEQYDNGNGIRFAFHRMYAYANL